MEVRNQPRNPLKMQLDDFEDREYLVAKRTHGLTTLHAREMSEAPAFDKMNETTEKKQLQRVWKELQKDFESSFGDKAELTLRRAAADLGIEAYKVPLTVGEIKLLFDRADAANRIVKAKVRSTPTARGPLQRGTGQLLPRQAPKPASNSHAMPPARMLHSQPGVGKKGQLTTHSQPAEHYDEIPKLGRREFILARMDAYLGPPIAPDERDALCIKILLALEAFERGQPAPQSDETRQAMLERVIEGEVLRHELMASHVTDAATDKVLKLAFQTPGHALGEWSTSSIRELLMQFNASDVAAILEPPAVARFAPPRMLMTIGAPFLKGVLDQFGPAAAIFVANAPQGLSIGADYSVTGQQVVSSVPYGAAGRLVGFRGRTFAETLTLSMNRQLKTATEGAQGESVKSLVVSAQNHDEGNDMPEDVGHVPDELLSVVLPAGTQGDFARMSCTIGSFQSKKNKPVATVQALYAFTDGDAKAVQVLAAVLSQANMHWIPDMLIRADGNAALCSFKTVGGLKGITFTLTKAIDADGEVVSYQVLIRLPLNLDVSPPLGQGDEQARSNLLKLGMSRLLGSPDRLLGVVFSMTIMVNVNKASEGILSLSAPGGLQVAFCNQIEFNSGAQG